MRRPSRSVECGDVVLKAFKDDIKVQIAYIDAIMFSIIIIASTINIFFIYGNYTTSRHQTEMLKQRASDIDYTLSMALETTLPDLYYLDNGEYRRLSNSTTVAEAMGNWAYLLWYNSIKNTTRFDTDAIEDRIKARLKFLLFDLGGSNFILTCNLTKGPESVTLSVSSNPSRFASVSALPTEYDKTTQTRAVTLHEPDSPNKKLLEPLPIQFELYMF